MDGQKGMKKLIALCMIAALAVITLGPALTVATTVDTSGSGVTTGLTRSVGGGASPIIKAKWEMYGPYATATGQDALPTAGAQFAPTGEWGSRDIGDTTGEMDFSICAIVTDPDGMADIDGVYTDWYYPGTVAFHPAPSGSPDHINGGRVGDPDFGINGCAAPVEDENQLTKLDKMDGYDLFCGDIRNNNNNLPTFFGLNGEPHQLINYSYDEICGETGELMKDTAYVYCADKSLEWEDPAGDYKVEILALDAAGLFSHSGETNLNYNHFEYLPLTGFEVDFESVEYGSVKLNTHKRISGDKTFIEGDGLPSVRNIGNTRLYMWVEQDDMGLGTTDGQWNIQYDARVGNNEADWKNYWPDTNTWLEDILDLSEVEEMDFSILITKFPFQQSGYTGYMDLGATAAQFRACTPQ